MARADLPFGDVVASLLIEADALKVSADKPFKLTSGKLSPIYFDCRRLISSPVAMTITAGVYQWLIARHAIRVDVVAGGESAGIPFADRLAATLGKPLVYVRKERRQHGTGSQIEGSLPPGAHALLVEDMITDGGSKLAFITGLRDAGAMVQHCFVALDRRQGGAETLEKEGVRLHALTTADSVLDYAARSGALPEADIRSALDYLRSPDEWSEARQKKA